LFSPVTFIKSQHSISIKVDEFSTVPNIGDLNSNSDLNTTRPLFFGGHPNLAKIRGIKSRRGFAGCIRNYKINGVEEVVNPMMAAGDVEVGVCLQN
jgi:hypothetical protein